MKKPYITDKEKAEYAFLSSIAKEVENKLSLLLAETARADIPESAKLNVLKWLDRASTFRGLSYMLHPQQEWMGGDSTCEANFRTREPHIANMR